MLLGLHHDVGHVDVDVAAKLREQEFLHAALEGGTGVLQAKRHGDVAIHPKGRDEGRLQGVGRVQLDLMIARVSIQEGQELTPGGGVDDLVDLREGERVFGAGLVEAGVVDTHAPGLVLLQDEDWIGQPLGVEHFHYEAGRQKLGDLFTNGSSLLFGKSL